jgi:transcriptional regulator with XRE-family HTH domain
LTDQSASGGEISERSSLGQLFRGARRALRLSQAAVAKRVRVSPVYISQLEAGHRTPSDRVAKDLADALNLPWREVLRRVYSMKSPEAGELFSDGAEPAHSPWRSVSEAPAIQFLLMQLAELELGSREIGLLLQNWRNDLELLKSQAGRADSADEARRDATTTS